MGKIIAIANLKGGVGKTTTAINLSAALGMRNHGVLLIDADPQSNATAGLGLESIKFGFYEFLSGTTLEKCLHKNRSLYFDLLPSNTELVKLELNQKAEYCASLMRSKVRFLSVDYDYILIDCPPSLGILLVSILSMSHSVVIPVECEYFAFQGLRKIFRTIKKVKEKANLELDVEGILITKYNNSVNEHKHILNCILEQFDFLTFTSRIPQNIKLAEAASAGISILEYDAASNGCLSYLNLADELIFKNWTTTNGTDEIPQRLKSLSHLNWVKDYSAEDLDFISSVEQTKNIISSNPGLTKFDNMVGLSKEEVKSKLGQYYNDMNSDIWMYTINEKFSFFKMNYFYIEFKNELVTISYLRRFKIGKLNRG